MNPRPNIFPLLAVIAATTIAGCGPAPARPRVVADVLLPRDELTMTITCFGDHTTGPPRVQAVWLRADGRSVATDWSARPEPEYDWPAQRLTVALPARARRLQLSVRVCLDGEWYVISLPLTREPAGADYRWRRGVESVQPVLPPARAAGP